MKLSKLLTHLILILQLTACGQSGKLFLPDPNQPPPTQKTTEAK